MLKKSIFKRATIAASVAFLLNGCSTTAIQQTKRETANDIQKTNQLSNDFNGIDQNNYVSMSNTLF